MQKKAQFLVVWTLKCDNIQSGSSALHIHKANKKKSKQWIMNILETRDPIALTVEIHVQSDLWDLSLTKAIEVHKLSYTHLTESAVFCIVKNSKTVYMPFILGLFRNVERNQTKTYTKPNQYAYMYIKFQTLWQPG